MSGLDIFFVLLLFARCLWAIRSLEKEITGLKLRVAELDRDLTALESTLTGDGR